MKLLAIVENVNQKYNKNLIGDIIVVDSDLVLSGDGRLCYQEVEHSRKRLNEYSLFQMVFELKHEVSNVEIIGVL